MKKPLILSFLTLAACISLNAQAGSDCIAEIDKRHYRPEELNFVACDIQPNEMPIVVSYLNKHPEITWLDIRQNRKLGDSVESLKTTKLKKIIAWDCNIGPKGAEGIAQIPTLEELDLFGNHIGDAGAIALSKTHAYQLELVANNITDKGAIALAQSPYVEYLELSGNKIRDKGAEAFARSVNLFLLNLNDNPISDKGIEGLSKSEGLYYLLVSGKQIGPASGKYLAANQSIGCLQIRNSNLGTEGAIQLAKTTTIIELDLPNNKIGHEGVAAIAQNGSFLKLNLSQNNLGDPEAVLLSKLPDLQEAWLDNNQIGPEGAKALAQIPKLKKLFLDNNQISDQGVSYLADKPFRFLEVGGNNLTNVSAFALASTSSIVWLDVPYNHIGPKGIEALRANKTIKHLNTQGNDGKNSSVVPESKKQQHEKLQLSALQNYCKTHTTKLCSSSEIKDLISKSSDY